MEDNGSGSKSEFLYEDDSASQPVVAAMKGSAPLAWETPKPILPQPDSGLDGPSPVRREMSALGLLSQETPQPQSYPILRDEKLQKSLLRHQEEMERLIKNISARIHLNTPVSSTTPSDDVMQNDASHEAFQQLDFDFTLRRHTGHDAVWQSVAGTSHKFYVYSAYYDTRGPRPHVRVIGATKTKRSDKVWCRLYYRDNRKSVTVPGAVSVIRENWNLKYSACFVICVLPTDQKTEAGKIAVPESVSIITLPPTPTSTGPPSDNPPPPPPMPSVTNQLPVLNARTGGTGSVIVNSSDVGVCVKPIHFDYDKTLELIEFLEMNKILGVTKFTLYNDTMSPEVSCVLRHYIAEGGVVVLPWKLNMISQKEIRTEGLFAALNDCLYRNMNDFRYLMLIDFDEFVIPHMNDTLPEMLQFLDQQKIVVGGRRINPKKTSSYSFQNSFFYLQFPDDEESRNWPALRILRKTRRKEKFNPQKQRSKYICVPRNVKEAGNHFIWEYSEGVNVNVPTSIGFLHHYRVCEFGGDDCVHTDNRVDRTVYRYRDLLVKNVEKVVQKLSDSCQLDKLQGEMSRDSVGDENLGKNGGER